METKINTDATLDVDAPQASAGAFNRRVGERLHCERATNADIREPAITAPGVLTFGDCFGAAPSDATKTDESSTPSTALTQAPDGNSHGFRIGISRCGDPLDAPDTQAHRSDGAAEEH